MELVYVSIVSTIGMIIGLIIYQRNSILNWSMKMDYNTNLMEHKIKIEQIKARKTLDLAEIKKTDSGGAGGIAGALGGLDMEQVGDILEQLQGDGGEGGILSNPIVKGLAQGFLKGKKEETPQQLQGVDFEE